MEALAIQPQQYLEDVVTRCAPDLALLVWNAAVPDCNADQIRDLAGGGDRLAGKLTCLGHAALVMRDPD